jgi:GntR family transcriptional regulator
LTDDKAPVEIHFHEAPFAMIPEPLIGRVSKNAYYLFGVMQKFSDNRTGECWPSHETLAKESDMSVSSVRRAIEELVEVGVLLRKPRFVKGKQTSNGYVLKRSLPRVFTGEQALLFTGEQGGVFTGEQQTTTHLELENNGARKAPAPTSELVGFYVDEYRKATGVQPPTPWKAAAGREVKRALKDYTEKDIKRGLYFAAHQGKNPGGLLGYITEYHLTMRQERRTTR